MSFITRCNTGCRLGELQRTNVEDVDCETKLFRVVRKGNKEDFVPINATLLETIKDELSKRKSVHPADPLFLNNHGERYKRITGSLRTACKEAGIPHTTHHGLRHASATLLHESGNDIGTISKLFGHANPSITQNVYVHWKDEEVRRAAETVAVGKCKKVKNSKMC